MQTFFLSFLAFFARLIIHIHRPFVIGVTGTVGKTTISTHIAKYLSLLYGEKNVLISPYHYNGEYGLPLSIIGAKTGGKNPFLWIGVFLIALSRMIRPYPRYVVLEYGIDHPGEMDFMLSIVIPDIAIISVVTPNHLEQFGSLENYRTEKLRITRDTPKIIAHESLRPYIEKDALYYGTGSMSDIDASHFHATLEGVSADIHVEKSTYRAVTLPGFGAYQIENILPLYGLSLFLATDPRTISENAHLFTPESGRSSIIRGSNDTTIIDGSYNGGLESICRGIDSLIPFLPSHRTILFLGDMRELGEHAEDIHQSLAHYIKETIPKERGVSLYLVGPLMTRYVAPLLSDTFEVVTSLSSRELGREIQSRIASENKPTLIYVKGSQNTLFLEEGIKSLIDTSQYHLLPRQSDSWMKKKEDFFRSLSLES